MRTAVKGAQRFPDAETVPLGDQVERWAFGVAVNVSSPAAQGSFDPRLRHWPNPSSVSTTIKFDLPRAEPVELAIYDARGRRVRTLLANTIVSGPCESYWDGRDGEGRPVGTGVYFYQLRVGDLTRTRKLTLLR